MRRIIAQPFPASLMTSTKSLGQAIRAARTQAGLGIREAASALGIAVQTLSDIEAGHAGVSVGNVMKAAVGLGVDLFAIPKAQRTIAEYRLADLRK